MVYLLQHTLGLLLLAAALWLPGLVLERCLAGSEQLGNLRHLASLVLGLGSWIVCAFLMAVTGLLDTRVLWAVVTVLVFGAIAVRMRAGLPVERPDPPSAGSFVALLVLAGVLLPFFLLAMSPPVSWDAGTYHLTLPRLFVEHGGFREVPLNVYSYWPLNVQLLYSLAMLVQDHVLAKLLHFAFGAATLYALFAGCRAFHRPVSGWLAIPLLLANGVITFELRVAYVDLAHAFLLLAGFLFMMAALEGKPRASIVPQSLWLAGLCCGLSAGVKVTGIVGAAVVGALYLPRLISAVRRGEARPAMTTFLSRFALPVAALWIPWLVRTAILTGNPFYPFLHGRFGGPDWSTELTTRLAAWQSSIGMGREPLDYLLLPLRAILAGGRGYERFDGELAAFWIVLVPLALWVAWRQILVRRCLVVAGLYFVYWALSSQQMRFLIPILPMLAIAAGVALVEMLDRLPASLRRAGQAAAFVAPLIFLIATQSSTMAAGYRTLGVYLSAEGDLRRSAMNPIYDFVNEQLPLDAKLLMLNTNQGFFCEREYLADSFFEASQIADWLRPAKDVAGLRALLAERGITHLLVEQRPRGIPYPPALGEMLQDPKEVQILERSKNGRFTVLELRQAPE